MAELPVLCDGSYLNSCHSYPDSQRDHSRISSLDHWVGRGVREWPLPGAQGSSLGFRTLLFSIGPLPGAQWWCHYLSAQATEATGRDAILIRLLDGHTSGMKSGNRCALITKLWWLSSERRVGNEEPKPNILLSMCACNSHMKSLVTNQM